MSNHYLNRVALENALWQTRMSQKEVAAAAGIPLSTFNNYMAMSRRIPYEAVVAIATALQTDAFSLLTPAHPKNTAMRLMFHLDVTPAEYADAYAEQSAA